MEKKKLSEYLHPRIKLIDLQAEDVLCTSDINAEPPLPSWEEDDWELTW